MQQVEIKAPLYDTPRSKIRIGRYANSDIIVKDTYQRSNSILSFKNELQILLFLQEAYKKDKTKHLIFMPLLNYKLHKNHTIMLFPKAACDLLDLLIHHKNKLDWDIKSIAYLCWKMSEAVFWLHHDFQLMHCDISLENFVVTKPIHEAKDIFTSKVRLIDWEFACKDAVINNADSPHPFNFHNFGKLNYFHPYIADKKPFRLFQNDLYALAVCLWCIVCQRIPYDVENGDMDEQSIRHEFHQGIFTKPSSMKLQLTSEEWTIFCSLIRSLVVDSTLSLDHPFFMFAQ